MKELIYSLIVNIALLVLIANFLSKIQLIQDMIMQEKRSIRVDLFLSCIFGGLIILSDYLSIDVGSYSLNARIVGAMASGLGESQILCKHCIAVQKRMIFYE